MACDEKGWGIVSPYDNLRTEKMGGMFVIAKLFSTLRYSARLKAHN